MIDPGARSKLTQYLQAKQLQDNIISGFNALRQRFSETIPVQDLTAIPFWDKVLQKFDYLTSQISNLKVNLPKIFQVEGKVDVGTPTVKIDTLPAVDISTLPPVKIDELPDIKITNLADLAPYFDTLPAKFKELNLTLGKVIEAVKLAKPVEKSNLQVSNLTDLAPYFENTVQSINQLQQSFTAAILAIKPNEKPKDIKFPDTFKVAQFTELLDAMEELKNGFNILINKEVATIGFPDKDIPVHVTNFKYPNPVNNVWLNALNGYVHTTANNVGTTLVTLPNYGQLFNRRAVVIFNNSNHTIYFGGSDVTVLNGIPLPAGGYSPILDAGYNMLVYGIAETENNDIRVLEVSKTKALDVQE